jgi:hypothetical protein
LHYEKKKENGKWKMEKSQSCMIPILHQWLQAARLGWKVESGKWKMENPNLACAQSCRNTSEAISLQKATP